MRAVSSIVNPFFQSYMYLLGSKETAKKLRHLAKEYNGDIEQLVNLTCNGFEHKQKIRKSWVVTVKAGQVKSEISALCKIVKKIRPKRIVEIGSYTGATIFLFTQIAKPEKIVSIDLPGGPFGGGYPFWKVPLYKSLGGKGVVQLIRADSHSEETLGKLKTVLNNGPIDFLFIDGDHTYQGVKQDFEMYSPLVRKGGVIAFHDVAPDQSAVGCEVDRFWNVIKKKYRYDELIEKTDQRWAGIGVLYV